MMNHQFLICFQEEEEKVEVCGRTRFTTSYPSICRLISSKTMLMFQNYSAIYKTMPHNTVNLAYAPSQRTKPQPHLHLFSLLEYPEGKDIEEERMCGASIIYLILFYQLPFQCGTGYVPVLAFRFLSGKTAYRFFRFLLQENIMLICFKLSRIC